MVSKRERALLLCIAYPDVSTKYNVTFCMAGLTENGEFRRIYPVPVNIYRKKDFHKRTWIEYEIVGKGDGRKESLKINPKTIKIIDQASYIEVRNILEEKKTTLEALIKAQKEDNTSLGIIKPNITDFFIKPDRRRMEEMKQLDKQRTIYGGKLPVRIIPYKLSYVFKCSKECKGHSIMCEDIETQLYWKLVKKYKDDISKVEKVMKEKFVDWMIEKKKDLYFMMGTHYRWKTWLIISILYPPKRMSHRLEKWLT